MIDDDALQAAKEQLGKVKLVLLERPLFVPGVWNGDTYTKAELQLMLPMAQQQPPYSDFIQRNSVFWDHDDNGKTWVGEIPPETVRWKEGIGIVGDLHIVDAQAADRIAYQQEAGDSKFGISPRVNISREEVDNQVFARDIRLKSWALVVDPAQGAETMLADAVLSSCGGGPFPCSPILSEVRPPEESLMAKEENAELVAEFRKVADGVAKSNEAVLEALTAPSKGEDPIKTVVEGQAKLTKSIESLVAKLASSVPDKPSAAAIQSDLISKLLPFGAVPKLDTTKLSEAEAAEYDRLVKNTDDAILNALAFAAKTAEEKGVDVLIGGRFPVSFDRMFSMVRDVKESKGSEEASLTKEEAQKLVDAAVAAADTEQPKGDETKGEGDEAKFSAKDVQKMIDESLAKKNKRKGQVSDEQALAIVKKSEGSDNLFDFVDREKYDALPPDQKLRVMTYFKKGMRQHIDASLRKSS